MTTIEFLVVLIAGLCCGFLFGYAYAQRPTLADEVRQWQELGMQAWMGESDATGGVPDSASGGIDNDAPAPMEGSER